jgi:hypothetical protein
MSGQVSVKISKQIFVALVEGSTITGVPVEQLVENALLQFLECDLAVMVEEQAERAATA